MARVVLNTEYTDKWTDEKLNEIEKQLNQIYSKQWKSLSKKQQAFFKKLEEQAKPKRKQVEEGTLTENEYKIWLMNTLRSSTEWQELKKDMLNTIAKANEEASEVINDKTTEVFTQNFNYESYQAEKATGISMGFLTNELAKGILAGMAISYLVSSTFSDKQKKVVDSVSNTVNSSNYKLFNNVGVNAKKTYFYNDKRINKIIDSGITSGLGIPDMAKNVEKVLGFNKATAKRIAQTSVTSAQNSARYASRKYLCDELDDDDLHIRHQWIASHDEITRDSHAHIDGEIVEIGDKFSNGLRYCGDPSGTPAEVYNCRCTTKTIIDGINDTQYTDSADYKKFKEWVNAKDNIDEDGVLKNVIDGSIKYKNLRGFSKKYSGLNKDLRKDFENGLQNSDSAVKTIIEKYSQDALYYESVGIKKSSTVPFLKSKPIIIVGKNAKRDTIAHELFHYMDNRNGYISHKLTESLQADKDKILSVFGDDPKNFMKNLTKVHPNITKLDDYGDYIFKSEYEGIADIINGMTGGEIKTGYKHSKTYWEKPHKLEHEAIAEYGRTYYNNKKEVTDLFEDLFPETLSKINSLLEDIK